MNNRVTFKIDSLEYTISTDKEPSYVLEIAEMLEDSIQDNIINNKLPPTRAITFSAFKYIDKYLDSLKTIEKLRDELQSYIKTNEKLTREINTLKKEKG